ncbi:hypothetical protein VNI00_010015 [Paramarasmius palmivorus]|uniref:BTB domain-containing protein n=1 Tax=Paramarasmius palmivorus TaxID=297713 RepID=A0AAW0CPC5_9AGAR
MSNAPLPIDDDELESDILLNWLETSVTALFSATDPEASTPSAEIQPPDTLPPLIAEEILVTQIGVQSSDLSTPITDTGTTYASLLTPAASRTSRCPTPQEGNPATPTTISISRVFGPNIHQSAPRPPVDLILLTTDSVIFYVDENTLLNASNNQFNSRLPLPTREKQKRVVFLPGVTSPELQIVLQCLYNVPNGDMPDIDTVIRGIDRLSTYGMSPKALVKPRSHMYEHLLSCAPLNPLQVYSTAAFHDMYSLAVQVSAHLLVVDLSKVTEEFSVRMGTRYLMKLVRLHLGRTEVLKGLLTVEPELHNPTKKCGFEDQKRLKRDWNYGVARLCWLIKADTTTSTIKNIIVEATKYITCEECIRARDVRLNALVAEWSLTSRTIY